MFASKMLIAFATLCVLGLAHGQMITACRKAYRGCDFRFSSSKYLPTFSLKGKPDTPFTSTIVSKSKATMIGILNTNITVQFVFMKGAFDITSYANPNFTPYHFKPFPVKKTKMSGIGHQTFTGNQMKTAKGKCVRIYFSAYQVLNSKGNVVDNVNDVMMDMNKCVVFKIAK